MRGNKKENKWDVKRVWTTNNETPPIEESNNRTIEESNNVKANTTIHDQLAV